MRWPSLPQYKLEISGETYTNDVALNIVCKRPENNVSYLALSVDDYQSRRYVDVFDPFDSVDLSLRYDSDTWVKVFSGTVSTVKPQRSVDQGEILGVGAWGEAKALVVTHCDEAYGVESLANTGVDTPKEIIDDLMSEHVEKEFGGAASGYTIGDKVENVHSGFSITHLNSQYLNNFVNVNRVCSLTNAYAQGLGTPEVSIHWYMDTSANLYVKKIDADHSDGNWDRYYGGSQTAATIEVDPDMILYDFSKNVEEYANSIVLSSALRKPSEDYWTESGSSLWGETGGGNGLSDSSAAGEFVVGANSLKHLTNGATTYTFYPSAKNAAWDLEAIGSEHTISSVNFYLRASAVPLTDCDFHLYTSVGNTCYYDITALIAAANTWYHFSFPVGPYWDRQAHEPDFAWSTSGTLDWGNINWLEFEWDRANNDYILVDDMHFSGVVVREARDTSEITANNLYQRVIRNDTATNDTLVASDDSGTAAMLAYAELLRRSQTPTVATIQIPMLPDLLPGQTLHLHACKKADATYRVDADFRVKDLRHEVYAGAGFRTVLNLTSDVTNTHAFAVPSQYKMMKEYAGALGHSEARNLKGGAMDNLIPRLSKNY